MRTSRYPVTGYKSFLPADICARLAMLPEHLLLPVGKVSKVHPFSAARCSSTQQHCHCQQCNFNCKHEPRLLVLKFTRFCRDASLSCRNRFDLCFGHLAICGWSTNYWPRLPKQDLCLRTVNTARAWGFLIGNKLATKILAPKDWSAII